jgi:hypothetical protein
MDFVAPRTRIVGSARRALWLELQCLLQATERIDVSPSGL